MNNKRRETQDLNWLSAYLDNALTASEQEELETRLKQEPALRERLENLQKTKLLLGQLTRLHAPRNYTLTPDMVTLRRPRRRPLFTTLRLASSLAAILLVVLVGIELVIGRRMTAAPLMGSEPMMESARVADDPTPEPLILWAEPGLGGGGEEGDANGMGSTDMFAVEEPVMESEALPPQADEEEGAQPKDTPLTEPEREIVPQEPPEDELESFSAADQAEEDQNIILGTNPEQGGEIIERSQPGIPEQETSQTWPTLIRWAQIALAAIAVGGGLTLWILTRRRLS